MTLAPINALEGSSIAELQPNGSADLELDRANSPSVKLNQTVSLVCMPWHTVESPSIQLGILKAVLQDREVLCQSHSLHLEFQEFLLKLPAEQGGLTPTEYQDVCTRWGNLGVGEWVFAVQPACTSSKSHNQRYVAMLRENGVPREFVTKLYALRERIPEFLERCADEILKFNPSVVGFTTVYSQTWPSAALAYTLKQRNPELTVVFGGASCEGIMGPATLKAFPWIDVVVRGEAEEVVVDLVKGVSAGTPLSSLCGVCVREGRTIVEGPVVTKRVSMDEIPVPDYKEYFERLAQLELLESSVLPRLPVETSRGCWWGEKKHCTFCGLNGEVMLFRSKSPQRVLDELMELSAKHETLDFTVVDNILDMSYLQPSSLLSSLAEGENSLSLFYETKANLKREQVALLSAAGVRTIQPGIESLSTNVLNLMDKGVTALQNVRLLKWCAEYKIHVIWNLLYGFPGETAEDYDRMTNLAPSVVHLTPPNLSELALYRFSPHFENPEKYGLKLDGPLPFYRYLFDLDDQALAQLAHSFKYSHVDGRRPDAYLGRLPEVIEDWRSNFAKNWGGLSYRSGPNFLQITDSRTTTTGGGGLARYKLNAQEAQVYLACDAGATVASIQRNWVKPGQAPETQWIQGTLEEMVNSRLMMEEGGKFLSLAIPFKN